MVPVEVKSASNRTTKLLSSLLTRGAARCGIKPIAGSGCAVERVRGLGYRLAAAWSQA